MKAAGAKLNSSVRVELKLRRSDKHKNELSFVRTTPPVLRAVGGVVGSARTSLVDGGGRRLEQLVLVSTYHHHPSESARLNNIKSFTASYDITYLDAAS